MSMTSYFVKPFVVLTKVKTSFNNVLSGNNVSVKKVKYILNTC